MMRDRDKGIVRPFYYLDQCFVEFPWA